jgi:hypothetical protein
VKECTQTFSFFALQGEEISVQMTIVSLLREIILVSATIGKSRCKISTKDDSGTEEEETNAQEEEHDNSGTHALSLHSLSLLEKNW